MKLINSMKKIARAVVTFFAQPIDAYARQRLLLYAVTHPTTVRNGIADYVTALCDVSGPGNLVFRTSGDVEVATLPFSATAFGAATGGVCTAATITDDTNATGGTIAKATLEDGAAATVCTCSVTATGGGGDIELSSVVVSAGQTVSVSSLTYTAPA